MEALTPNLSIKLFSVSKIISAYSQKNKCSLKANKKFCINLSAKCFFVGDFKLQAGKYLRITVKKIFAILMHRIKFFYGHVSSDHKDNSPIQILLQSFSVEVHEPHGNILVLVKAFFLSSLFLFPSLLTRRRLYFFFQCSFFSPSSFTRSNSRS